MLKKMTWRWRRFWLSQGGYNSWGRLATRLGSLGVGPNRCRIPLARLTAQGYISPSAEIAGVDLKLGSHVFIGDRVVIGRWGGEGTIELGDSVQIHWDASLEISTGGAITVGPEAAIERGCMLFSVLEPIHIGKRAEIAAYCTFFSYDHGIAPGREIFGQPARSKGPIIIEEDVWLGVGVRVLCGVRIGRGAVVGAGSVVTRDIPAGAIAVGAPARVIKYRHELAGENETQAAKNLMTHREGATEMTGASVLPSRLA